MKAVTSKLLAHVTWRHVRRGYGIGKRGRLPAEAISICVINVSDGTDRAVKLGEVVVTDVAVCVDGDQFSRQTGRWNSLAAALKQAFFARHPDRIELAEEIVRQYRQLNPQKEREVRGAFDPTQRAQLINYGAAKRAERTQRKLGHAKDV